MGVSCIVIGIIILGILMYVLFLPPANIAIPSYIVGIGTILALIALAVALLNSGK